MTLLFMKVLPLNFAYSQDTRTNSSGWSRSLRTLDLESVRKELNAWDESVRGFRKGHHFSLVSGPTRGRWRIAHFGEDFGEIFSDSGVLTKVVYAYHLQLFRSFGYFLGTSFGYWINSSVDAPRFDIDTSELVPGTLAGLCFNFGPAFRIHAGVSYGIERVKGLGIRSVGEDGAYSDFRRVDMTARNLGFYVGFDFFFSLIRSIHFEYSRNELKIVAPLDAVKYDVNVDASKEDNWFALGVSHHIL